MASPIEGLPQAPPELIFDPAQPLPVIGYERIDGREVLVYETNSLDALYSAFLRVEGIEEGPGPGLYDGVILQNWRGAHDILLSHAAEHPDRLQEIMEYNRRRAEDGPPVITDASQIAGDPGREWRGKVLYSEVFKEIAPIAEQLYPGCNPLELCV